MATLEPFVQKIKPALDVFLRAPNRGNLTRLRHELQQFSWTNMKIFHVQILAPLILKLEELRGQSQDLTTGTIDCIRIVACKLYLTDLKALRTLLVIVLMQVRDSGSVTTKANLSEELKLAVVQCISVALRRASSDVLESFYTKESEILLGQVLLTLVEFIEKEKYKKLISASVECLMVVFYVHDDAVFSDVVLRSQVADTMFRFLPKVVVVLFRICLSDEKLGETIKALAIKALGRILCVIYEETDVAVIKNTYGTEEFKSLLESATRAAPDCASDAQILGNGRSNEPLEEQLKRIQQTVRSEQWFNASSRQLRVVCIQTSILRTHGSVKVREEYARMCCCLIQQCGRHLRENFKYLLENVVAMSEDEAELIRTLCRQTMQQLQSCHVNEPIFDQNCELLLDEHLVKLPRIIKRCDEAEQYAEFMFLKGFLLNLSAGKLHVLLSIPHNFEMVCMCLLSAVDLKISSDLLVEEYALREMSELDTVESAKLHWRQFRNLSSRRCVEAVKQLCGILGKTKHLNRIIFDYLLELLTQGNEAMNEILLTMLWMATAVSGAEGCDNRIELVEILLNEILLDKHWHLALKPDHVWRLKVDKPTDWFVDRTPGLYESAIEIRTQDYDSDDDNDAENDRHSRVTILDAEFNVLHTCLLLDVLGHCAQFRGESFDRYLFRCLHRVLLKAGSSNTMVYQAATFCLTSIQHALRFAKVSHFIETHADYITYHLNTILKRSPESRSAVEILTVVLQFSTRNALPHLESTLQTIREECSKSHQSENINAYLRVFNAFVAHIGRWQSSCDTEIRNIPMNVDCESDSDVLADWLAVLQRQRDEAENVFPEESQGADTNEAKANVQTADTNNDDDVTTNCDTTPELPRHIEMVKDILNEALKFISSADKCHQILALECLIAGLPLLSHYENELLPLVHLIWQPLAEKFRQKDAIVLNRCFTLLNVLATYAKDFILKRSLDDVIPFLKEFLLKAASHSSAEVAAAQTQEYKLQVKLLRDFPNLIQSIQIDGKYLNDIAEVISLYLSEDQPKELQDYAVQCYLVLRLYDGPFTYLVVLKKAHLGAYKTNVAKVLSIFGVK